MYDDLPRPAWEELNFSHIGRKVIIGGTQRGILRYIGETDFDEGEWCGIELEEKIGRHNGTVKGVQYFVCRSGHGLMAPLSKVVLDNSVDYDTRDDYRRHNRLPEYEEGTNMNRRSDPTCSTTKIDYPDVNINRFSDCTSDRLIGNTLLYEKYNSEIIHDNHKLINELKNSSVQRKSSPDYLPSKHIRSRFSYLDTKNGCISGGVSPDDVTCDDSSLGILTPNQMPDFTSTSIQPSPSDDVVDLPMDCCEGAAAVEMEAWDFSEDASAVINELQKCDEDLNSSSGSSSPPYLPTSINEGLSHDQSFENDATKTSNKLKNDRPSNIKSVSFNDERSIESANIDLNEGHVENNELIPSTESACTAVCANVSGEIKDRVHVNQNTVNSIVKESYNADGRGGAKPKHRTRHHTSTMPESNVEESISVSSNTGESNEMHQISNITRHSLPAARLLLNTRGGKYSVSENTRNYDHSIEDRPSDGSWHPSMTLSSVSLDPGYQGDGEFDVPSEIGSGSAGTPTQDPQESNIHEEVADAAQMPLESSSGLATEADISLGDDEDEDDDDVESESSFIANRTARVIDGKLYHSHREMMLRGQEGQMRGADQHTSEMDSSGFYSDLDPREDENIRLDAPPLQPLEEYHDSDLQDNTGASNANDFESDKRKSVSRSTQVNAQSDFQCDDDEKSTASTLRPESKEFNGSDRLEASPAPSEQTVKLSKNEEQCNSAADLLPNGDSEDPAVAAEAAEKVRNYEKPWLSKPVIKKPEPSKKIIAPPPPRPKKNVESKLKAMLAAQEPMSEERKHRQPVKKNKWDEVMNKIAEGKEQDKERPKVKEVKSRLLESLKAPAPMSPQAERIRQERKERRERRERQAVAAAVARRNAVRAERKRRYRYKTCPYL